MVGEYAGRNRSNRHYLASLLELSANSPRCVFPDEYAPQDDTFYAVVTGIEPPGWRVLLDAPWYHCIPPRQTVPLQGWKVHVSAASGDAVDILARTARLCFQEGVPFKFASDRRLLEWMNGKNQDRGASGKFITVYPADTQQVRDLLAQLHQRLEGLHGPFILSDRRYRNSSVLYYRYGGIRALTITDVVGDSVPYLVKPDGHLVPDVRLPRFVSHPWSPDPIAPPAGPSLYAGPRRLLHGRYQVQGALQFSNAGGVYRAWDQRSGEPVVIKEARPWVAMDGNAEDAQTRLRRAWEVGQALAESGYVARPVEYFAQWEHEFLVTAWVEGTPLDAVPGMRHPIVQLDGASLKDLTEYYGTVRQLIITIGRALRDLNARSPWRLGDLSPSNILIRGDGRPVFVDLESAVDPAKPMRRRMATVGFDRPSLLPDEGFEIANLLLWLCGFQPQFTVLNPDAARTWFLTVAPRIGIPDAMTSALETFCFGTQSVGLDRALEAFTAADGTAVRRPAHQDMDFQGAAASAIAGVIDSLDYSSPRVIPTHFQPGHPLSVAHGLVGVMYAIHRLGATPPPSLREAVIRRLDSVTPARVPPGLYMGLAGMAWALADCGYMAEACAQIDQAWRHELLLTAADVFYGAAGVGLTFLHLWQVTGRASMRTRAAELASWLVSTATREGAGVCWHRGTEAPRWVGYARGSSGIALFLLYAGLACNRRDFITTAEEGLAYDLQWGIRSRAAVSFPEQAGDTRLREPYWYMGTAGVGTALVRFLHVGRAQAWRATLPLLVADTRRVLSAHPGLFSGLAGLGNFLLDCAQFGQGDDGSCLAAAADCARSVVAQGMVGPSGTRYPGDLMHKESADFGTGAAGIALFLHRLSEGTGNFNFLLDTLLESGV